MTLCNVSTNQKNHIFPFYKSIEIYDSLIKNTILSVLYVFLLKLIE